jgi:glycine/D-amino acid oxidase-like deaminating enzyme
MDGGVKDLTRIAIIGAGVVGAAIAYELSQVGGLQITLLDGGQPAQAATSAALGVMMGGISQKAKGGNLRRRLASIQLYDEWIPRLEAMTGKTIPYNRQGILRLCFEEEDMEFWRSLVTIRQTQGWQLQLYDRPRLTLDYPQVQCDRVIAAVYSPQDRQVDPVALTRTLVAAAERNGVEVVLNTPVTGMDWGSEGGVLRTPLGEISADWLVIAAGLGSTPLTADLQQPVDLRPVLGQAVQVQLDQPLGNAHLQPVITGEDTHLVPLGGGGYWVGATVEFPLGEMGFEPPTPNARALEQVRNQAISFCPGLTEAKVVRTWSGLRPRPEGRPAPIIERLPGYTTVLLATGHYRNGILLAPATAREIRQMIGQ